MNRFISTLAFALFIAQPAIAEESQADLAKYISCYTALSEVIEKPDPWVWDGDEHFIFQTEKYEYKTCYKATYTEDGRKLMGKPVEVEISGGLTYYVFSPNNVQRVDFFHHDELTNTRYDLLEADGTTPCKTIEPPLYASDMNGNHTYFEIKLADSQDRFFMGLNFSVASGLKIPADAKVPDAKYLNGLKEIKKYMPGKTKLTGVEIPFNDEARTVLQAEIAEKMATFKRLVKNGTISKEFASEFKTQPDCIATGVFND